MGELGMQMPAGRSRRAASMNIYTGLLFAAVAALAVACGIVWRAASMVGASGSPFKMQEENRISLPAEAAR